MQLRVYALLDTKAQYFGIPFFCQSDGEAVRACMEAANDMRSTIGRYPTDFSLFRIGHYDNQTAQLVPVDRPENLGVVLNFLPIQSTLPLENAAE